MQHYADYTLADFLKDETFQHWVFAPDNDNEAYWQGVAILHPTQQPVIRKARQLLQSVRFNEYVLDPADQQHTLHQILHSIRTPVIPLAGRRAMIRPALRKWIAIAAVVTGIIAATLGVFVVSGTREISYATAYGQQQNVVLPDGSSIAPLPFQPDLQNRRLLR